MYTFNINDQNPTKFRSRATAFNKYSVSVTHLCVRWCVLMFCDNLSLDIHLHVDNDFRSLKPISPSLGSEESLHSLAVL